MWAERDGSGKRSGACVEWAERNGEQESEKTSGAERSAEQGSRSGRELWTEITEIGFYAERQNSPLRSAHMLWPTLGFHPVTNTVGKLIGILISRFADFSQIFNFLRIRIRKRIDRRQHTSLQVTWHQSNDVVVALLWMALAALRQKSTI